MRIRRVVTVSTLEFIEGFGGNAAQLERSFQELEDMVDKAKEVYVKHNDAAQASQLLGQVLERYPALEAEIIRVKERTLLWIYIIEWLVVTSTMTIVGTVLWSLMVRRRLYRQVSTTRLTHQPL